MADPRHEAGAWYPWVVAEGSGFEVRDPSGRVALVQIDRKRFLVSEPFRFTDDAVQTMLVDHLVGKGRTEDDARRAVEDARTFRPSTENPTDMASIPLFMRWFENSYGNHTLAAIIHDELIVDEPNGGVLGSDTLSDRFFREMMRRAGVSWLKRWIMWSAVALRSKWAVGGVWRLRIILWIGLALAGITSFVLAAGSTLFDWGTPADVGVLVAIAVLLPFASAPLWGKQYGAGLVAAVAALWILPAAIFGAFGWLVFKVLDWLATRAGLR